MADESIAPADLSSAHIGAEDFAPQPPQQQQSTATSHSPGEPDQHADASSATATRKVSTATTASTLSCSQPSPAVRHPAHLPRHLSIVIPRATKPLVKAKFQTPDGIEADLFTLHYTYSRRSKSTLQLHPGSQLGSALCTARFDTPLKRAEITWGGGAEEFQVWTRAVVDVDGREGPRWAQRGERYAWRWVEDDDQGQGEKLVMEVLGVALATEKVFAEFVRTGSGRRGEFALKQGMDAEWEAMAVLTGSLSAMAWNKSEALPGRE